MVYTADREAMLNTMVAAHLLQMVAVECVAMVRRPVQRKGKIIITAGLRSVMEAIRKVLQAGLSKAVWGKFPVTSNVTISSRFVVAFLLLV